MNLTGSNATWMHHSHHCLSCFSFCSHLFFCLYSQIETWTETGFEESMKNKEKLSFFSAKTKFWFNSLLLLHRRMKLSLEWWIWPSPISHFHPYSFRCPWELICNGQWLKSTLTKWDTPSRAWFVISSHRWLWHKQTRHVFLLTSPLSLCVGMDWCDSTLYTTGWCYEHRHSVLSFHVSAVDRIYNEHKWMNIIMISMEYTIAVITFKSLHL